MMDLGATICTPKNPACALCPWNRACAAYARGVQERFPRKAEKKTGALRRGAAFVAVRTDGFLLTRMRPEKGLLGGMTEVPTSEWTRDFDEATSLAHAPLKATWRRVPGVVTHTFTHFPLELSVYGAEIPGNRKAPAGMRWTPLAGLAGEALPNVMRKVVAHALGSDTLKPS
jgi:A/G-specific adenine glycosylase